MQAAQRAQEGTFEPFVWEKETKMRKIGNFKRPVDPKPYIMRKVEQNHQI